MPARGAGPVAAGALHCRGSDGGGAMVGVGVGFKGGSREES